PVRAGRGPGLDRRVPGAGGTAAPTGAEDRVADGHGGQQGRPHRDPGHQDRHAPDRGVDPRQGHPGARRGRGEPGLPPRLAVGGGAHVAARRRPRRGAQTFLGPARAEEVPVMATTPNDTTGTDADELRRRVAAFLAEHDPATTERLEFLRARFDAGLAWVHFPVGLGGLGLARELQSGVEAECAAADAPANDPRRNGIGLGMAAPTTLAVGTEDQKRRFLRPLWTGEEIWCQLFSEPGAGSDLAALATRAVQDEKGDWIVTGQKVWTSSAHNARWAILLARTDPDVPKHRGLTYFVCDTSDPGVEVRPPRQITGEAEFNEVFLTEVRIPDAHRRGPVGDGWRVAQTTLMNERVAIGGNAAPRESGMLGKVAHTWRQRPELRTAELHERLLRLWVEQEAFRLAGIRLRQQLAAGEPGPEGSRSEERRV